MHDNATAAPSGVVIARGYGLKIHVSRGHLIVEDGFGRDRRQRRYNRATGDLKRLMVVGHTGYVTLEATRWIHDIGATLVHLSPDGTPLATSTVCSGDVPQLRRAQAAAPGSAVGFLVARWILEAKVSGQASLLEHLPASSQAVDAMRRARNDLANAGDIPLLISAEANAASAYWEAWKRQPVSFGVVDVPDHWRTFGSRHSPLSRSSRAAINPANAILNYLYTLLEIETTIACHAVGLDPGLGIFHRDRRRRASLAADVMETIRPTVDAWVLALLNERTLSVKDFAETRTGQCRITPRLTTTLADTRDLWANEIAPIVERTADLLASDVVMPDGVTAPLTGANGVAAWNERRPARAARAAATRLPAACRDCGAPVPTRRHRYCADCRLRRFESNAPAARAKAVAVLAQLRADNADPAHGGTAGRIRAQKNAAHQAAVRDWNAKTEPPRDPSEFTRAILPGLKSAPIADLVAATGLSPHYCSLIRLGKRVPHERHWEALTRI